MSRGRDVRLKGNAVPAEFNDRVDHTYVTSENGHAWGCWGRNNGGRVLTEAGADIEFAECLAEGDGRAGIVYGLTGLCHQTANRILFPCARTVHAARGYVVSVFVFGNFGVDRWDRLSFCQGEDNALVTELAPDVDGDWHEMSITHGTGPQNLDIYMEFVEAVRRKGVDLTQSELKFLKDIQQGLWDRHQELWREYNNETISNGGLHGKLSAALLDTLTSAQTMLGKKRFKEIFGDKPEYLNIFDPNELRGIPPKP